MILVIPLMAFLYIKNQVKETKVSGEIAFSVKSRVNFKKLIPIFVIGFLLVSIIRSIGDIGIDTTNLAFWVIGQDSWDDFIKIVKDFATILFVIALGGVGFSTDFGKFKGLGIKPFLLGLFAALIIGIVSFVSVSLLGGLITF